jgi:hypothetical protein
MAEGAGVRAAGCDGDDHLAAQDAQAGGRRPGEHGPSPWDVVTIMVERAGRRSR